MKTTPLLIACLLATQAHANLILLSENRSVSVSGFAQGHGAEIQSYSQTATPSALFAPESLSVIGSADSTDVFPAYPSDPLFPSHADSQSNQTSTINSNEITVNGSLRGYERIGFNGGSNAIASMGSVFEVSFRVDAPTGYDLSVQPLTQFHQDGGGPFSEGGVFDFSLTSASHGEILGYYDFRRASILGDLLGILQPDDYTLRLNASVSLVPDPIGDLAWVEYGVTFTDPPIGYAPTSVPDGGSTLWLFGIAVAAMLGIRPHRLKSSRIP